MARESLAAFSSKAFRLQPRASIGLTAACLSPRPCVTTSVADPFVGLEGRDPRDVRVIRECIFKINFLCVLFFADLKKTLAFADQNNKQRFHWRFCSSAIAA